MKIHLIIISLSLLPVLTAHAQFYKSTQGTAAFYSKAPLEDIDATSTHIVSGINSQTNEIAFSVAISSFEFRNKRMQDDFNEDFMDSDKYPYATYTGKINEKIDWSKPGTYKVTSNGSLTIHGVKKERLDSATITIKNKKIVLESEFKVHVADHKIRVPRIFSEKIAEVVVVKLVETYQQSGSNEKLLLIPAGE
jgi:polyisoprenoid-binding protein YceI